MATINAWLYWVQSIWRDKLCICSFYHVFLSLLFPEQSPLTIKLCDCLLKYLQCFAPVQNICLVYKLQKAPMYLCRFQHKELSFLKVSFLTRKKSILLSSSLEGIIECNTDKVKPMLPSSHCSDYQKEMSLSQRLASYRHKMYFIHFKYQLSHSPSTRFITFNKLSRAVQLPEQMLDIQQKHQSRQSFESRAARTLSSMSYWLPHWMKILSNSTKYLAEPLLQFTPSALVKVMYMLKKQPHTPVIPRFILVFCC